MSSNTENGSTANNPIHDDATSIGVSQDASNADATVRKPVEVNAPLPSMLREDSRQSSDRKSSVLHNEGLTLSPTNQGIPGSSNDNVAGENNAQDDKSEAGPKADKQESGLSDGEDVASSLGSDVDLDEEVDNILLDRALVDDPNRKVLAKRRFKQHFQYTRLMEERVDMLERRYSELERLLKKQPPLGTVVDGKEDHKKIYEINHKTWRDFVDLNERHHAIDILVGERIYTNEDMKGTLRRVTLLNALNSGTIEETIRAEREESSHDELNGLQKAVENLRGRRLPEQIRINCAALHILLRNFLLGPEPGIPWSNSRTILLAPFKPLLHFEHEIKNLRDDLLAVIESMRLPSPVSETCDVSQNRVDHSITSNDTQNQVDLNQAAWKTVLTKFELPSDDPTTSLLALECSSEVEVRKTFDCLFEFIDQYLKPITLPLRNRKVQKVCFADLWHLFQVGDDIITKVSDNANDVQMMRVLRTEGGRRRLQRSNTTFDTGNMPEPNEMLQSVNQVNPFVINAWYIDIGTHGLVPIRTRIVIQPYTGEELITDLEVYPVEYTNQSKQIKAYLASRGKKFTKFMTSDIGSYCHCKGEDMTSKEELDEKVIIDTSEFRKRIGSLSFTEPPAMDFSETKDCSLENLPCNFGKDCPHTRFTHFHDQFVDRIAMKDYRSSSPFFQKLVGGQLSKDVHRTLTDDDYALCNYHLPAYKLRAREWVPVHIDSLEEVQIVDDPEKSFERLVLPPAHKHIIKSQVKEHFRRRLLQTTSQDELDLVRGKGQGLIILLHGAPGVGKTCTAETISDLVQKPLYPITCGDLGSTAQDVETKLKEHFMLASRWDCVMLLDEADVFLAKRKTEDLQRNSIVSVFLRILEYYKGLLFLTTNRVGTFDEAFRSRVHISLFYPDFDRDTTIKVWKTFINQTRETVAKRGIKHFRINKREILDFAEEHWDNNTGVRWNGRQIRNAFHTAIAMADFDARAKEDGKEPSKIVLGREQFAQISSTVEAFERYMDQTVGMKASDKAAKERYRRRAGSEKRKEKSSSKKKRTTRRDTSDEDEDSSPSQSEKEKSKKKRAATKGRRDDSSESENTESD